MTDKGMIMDNEMEAAFDAARDTAVNFVFERLAAALGLEEWTVRDGSETWEGDVAGTLWGLLTDADIIDADTGALHPVMPAGFIPTMWADVKEDEETGRKFFLANEADNQDGPHVLYEIDFDADTFPVRSKIVVSEPTP